MIIKIHEKYMYVYENNTTEMHLAYFEEFESMDKKNNVIKICPMDKKSDKFLTDNHYMIQHADVYWFNDKKLVYRVMFIKNIGTAFDHMVLITPKLLKLNK